MSAFEHLEGMINRENLTISPELYIPEKVSPIMTVDQFAHWLSGVLKKNSSSWLHYNLASLYWRARGNGPKAMECSRRAVHYAPREYKDIALFTMGTILHLSKMTEDAVVILNAAVDHNPNFHLSQFQLGNAYAVLCDFNSSDRHFGQCLKLDPNFKIAVKHKHGVRCLSNIWKKLAIVRNASKKLRDELTIYSQKEAQLLNSQSSYLNSAKHKVEHDTRNAAKNSEKMSELTGLDIKRLNLKGDKYSLIKHFLQSSIYTQLWSDKANLEAVDTANSFQRLVLHIEKQSTRAPGSAQSELLKETTFKDQLPILAINKPRNEVKLDEKQNGVKSTSEVEDEMKEFETGTPLYPSTMKINRNTEEFDKDPDWPSDAFCKAAATNFPGNVQAIYPVFICFENKGIRLGTLLTDKLGVPASEEYELPWHPPTCPQDKAAAKLLLKKPQKSPLAVVVTTDYMKRKLLEYVADGNVDLVAHMQVEEIGQRIYAATKKRLAPEWLLYTLASLYWRVRGNYVSTVHCLFAAKKTVPPRNRDLVLTSLASVCLETGHVDEALSAAEEAFRVALYEPATNFVLAELNMLQKNRKTQLFHLKQVLRVDGEFLDGLARDLFHGWACILKQVNSLTEMDYGDGEFCTQVEADLKMVCEKDGSNCHMIDDNCHGNKRKADTSAILRLMELKDPIMHKTFNYDMNQHVFEAFVRNMPADPSNFLGHKLNFNSLMITVHEELKGCGSKGCRNLQAEDLAMKEEDCAYHHLQLGYWLHIVCFKQTFADPNLKINAEIAAMTPSNKKVPECRLFGDSSKDFFLERVVRVDSSDWTPILSLMHQFAEMFNFFDYLTLGAKIAKYVETKPRSWMGALGAGWWCGAGGRGACAVRCLSAALSLAPPQHAALVLRSLVALLLTYATFAHTYLPNAYTQSKKQDAKEIAYLSFYLSPKSKIEAFLVAISHTCLAEYEQAIWMYRYALTFDEKYLPAKACLHATVCIMFYGENKIPALEE
ncbi:unnamed protein product, partial [Iphiclides podalirius]